MTNSFCGFLSNGLFITDKNLLSDLSYKPCCIYSGHVKSIEDINWKNIDKWTNGCRNCHTAEYVKKEKSRRTFGNTFDKNLTNNEIIYLDIDFSNICNAACGICSSSFSSSIAKIEKLENKQIKFPSVKQDKLFEIISKLNLDNLKFLKFVGGEPFYSNFHKKILEKIPNPNQVEVLYQTNGSRYPDDEWWELASNFKNIDIIFSIDAIGKKFDYIRTNLNYSAVETNIIRIITNKKINLTTGINYTVNPFNAFYFDEIYQLIKKMKKEKNKVTLNWQQCKGNWDLINTPPILRQKINDKYKGKLFSNIFDILEFNEFKHEIFVESVKLHEARFNLNGLDTFPEIYNDALKYY